MNGVDTLVEVPRQPAGAAGGTGGQFTSRENTPPEGTLAESATGSFLYPPERFDSVEEYVEFFTTTPISDQVLSNASYAFDAWRKRQILNYVIASNTELKNRTGGPEERIVREEGHAGLERLVAENTARARAEAEHLYPTKVIPRGAARSILRAHQIVLQRGLLPEDIEDEVLQTPLPHQGDLIPARELVQMYQTNDWAPAALTENDYAQAETMGRVASLVARQMGDDTYDEFH